VSRSRSDGDDRPLIERSSHDLLNPVSSILGLGETLRARGSALGDEAIRSFGASIARQATRLEGAIHDLVTASRLLREDPVPETSRVDVEAMLAVITLDRVRVEAPAGSVVVADTEMLGDVLRRLIANALEFSSGDVVVRAGDGWIEVVDEGTGFEPEGLSRAFEPFAAGANARNDRGSGLGLGLYIARRYIEAHGGRLTATSSPGSGSVFRIELGT
jgi:two-component system, OmpR family, sensor kinase